MSTPPVAAIDLQRRIREIGDTHAGAYVIVTRGPLLSGNVSPIPFFRADEQMMGTLAFDPQNCRFYLAESGEGIAQVHDIEYDNGRLFISGWPTEGEWRWIRWVIEF